MFQLAESGAVRLLAQLLNFVAFSGDDSASRVPGLSIFSYSSEILEKRLKTATRRLRERAAFQL
jgi:hypothetical protein